MMTQDSNPIKPEFVQRLRALGQHEVADHLEHAYLLVRSQRDALGDIITHVAEALQTEGIADWGDGGELGDALIYVKDTVEEQYNNTKDLGREFDGPYDEVVTRRAKGRRDLVTFFLEYLEETCGLVLAERAGSTSAQERKGSSLVPTQQTVEQLVADFFARIEAKDEWRSLLEGVPAEQVTPLMEAQVKHTVEEWIAATIFDYPGNELNERECEELGQTILQEVLARFRPGL